MMNLDEFSRQIESMQARFMRLCPINGTGVSDFRHMWEETTEALGVTMEEMRVAEEELRQQSEELDESRRAIEAERQRYRDLFDFAPDGYLVTDLVGMIREANRATGELLGVSPKYLAGKPLASYVALDERPAFRLGLHRLQQVGRREGWVIRMLPRRGATYEATITAAVVRDWNGSPMGLRWLIREATEPASDEAVARRSRSSGRVTIGLAAGQARPGEIEQRWTHAEHEAEALRGLLYGIDLIVWEADAETGRYWFISPRAEELLGYPVESWIEEPGFWSRIIHADDRPLAEAQRARCLRDGRGGEMEYRVIAADGRAVWFRESLSVEVDGEGRPQVLRGCLWDIGRRKKVERQLYTDRRKLAEHLSDVWHLYLLGGQLLATLELGPVLEEVLSALTALLGAEMGAIRLLRGDRDELETVVSLTLPPEYLERFGRLPVGEQACGLAVRRGGPVIVEDVESDGQAAASWAEAARLGGFRACFSVPLVSRRGVVVGTIATFFREPHRPSERQLQMAEQYILQAADALDNARRHQAVRDSDRRKEEFLATLAHELRNPLGAIQTCAQLLRPDAMDAVPLEEVRDIIVRQAGHMARLVEDLLDASRISRGTIALRKESVDLAEVVARAVEHVRPQVDGREHQLVVSLPEGPVQLEADPTRLAQVLSNLLTNAAKYTDPGGRIDLIAVREDDELIVRVRDTGIGLAPEALSELFTLFTQVDAAQDRSGGGLGIGLALVKSLVELHGGSVSARSDGPGRGSEFTLRLPM
jgi:PAS domain S-box-containing protein